MHLITWFKEQFIIHLIRIITILRIKMSEQFKKHIPYDNARHQTTRLNNTKVENECKNKQNRMKKNKMKKKPQTRKETELHNPERKTETR